MIQWVHAQGLSEQFYSGFQGFGAVVTVLFMLWYRKIYRIMPGKALLTLLIIYPIASGWSYLLSWAEGGFRQMMGISIVRSFVYIPLIAWPVAKLLKIKWSVLCDFAAPCLCLCVGISQIGCVFAGCCAGYPCSWGIYNPIMDMQMFPIQLVEVAALLIIAGTLVYRACALQTKSEGLQYPLMLMLFGVVRIACEFARDNRKIFIGFSALGLHGVFMALVGLDLYITISEQNRKRAIIARKYPQKNGRNRK